MLAPYRPLTVATGLLLAFPAVAQTTWYVDVNATPPGNGSPGSPYASIQYALDRPTTVADDVVLVLPGTYVETIATTKNVELRSSDGPLSTILLPASPAAVAVVDLPGQGIIQGFTVTRTSTAPGQVGIRTLACPSSMEIRSCIVTNHDVGIAAPFDVFIFESTITENATGVKDTCALAAEVRNSILWGNSTVDFRGSPAQTSSIHYSSLGTFQGSGGCSCQFNVGDPDLWDGQDGDVRLRPGSPCIDGGSPFEQDPDGSRRDIGAVPYDPTWAPGTQAFCFGSAAACPCANGGSGQGGCDLPQGTGGIVLAIEDFAPDGSGGGDASIVGSGYPPAAVPAVVLIRSPAPQDPPVVLGDGLRCISANGLVRIGAVAGSGGASQHDVNHGAGAGTFYYQLWSRSTPRSFCDPIAAFNLSNALEIVWP